MLPIKRSGGALTRSFNGNKRTCNSGKPSESLISGDLWECKQGVWGELSEKVALSLSKSVVSLALCDGDTVLFASSGMAIECNMHVSRFLTSASLHRALEKEAKFHDNLEVKVCHKQRTVTGFLEVFDLDYDIAIVKILSPLDVQKVLLVRTMRFQLHNEVVAVGHSIRGEIMAISGKLTFDPRGYEDHVSLMFSTCNEAWEGGPLFDSLGCLVGMNLFAYMGTSCFLPKDIIIQRLEHFRTSQKRSLFLSRIKNLNAMRFTEGTSNGGIVLGDSFEQYFGDVYHKDVHEGAWKLLTKKVSKRLSRSVVALASFNGSQRFVSCTGVFIDCGEECEDNNVSTILTSASLVGNSYHLDGENKIVDNLKIEVRSPSGSLIEGTLMHYNLHYNIALISVKKKSAASLAIYKCKKHVKQSSKVLAVGCCFKSGDLMASCGELVAWSGDNDCKLPLYSTCKITKIGFGGPLVDLAGNFIGINFYDPIFGTLVVSRRKIASILRHLRRKGTSAHNNVEGGDYPNSIGDMLPIKRSGGALTRSFNGNKRTCNSGKPSESLISGDLWECKQGVWGELSEEVALSLSQSVVSLALCDGDTVLFASSGIAIECNMHVSRFLTSASLHRALEKEAKFHDNLEVKVCHKQRTVTGFLEVFDLDYDIAIVKILSSLDVQKVLLHRTVSFELHSDVVAVGHSIRGEIMATSGKLTCDPRGYEDVESLMFSTCNEAWEGGPLFKFCGAFVGMNLFTYMGNSCFVPNDIIIQRLEHFRTNKEMSLFLTRIKDLRSRLTEGTSQACGDAVTDLEYEFFKSLGYPRPPKRGMVLVNSFEQYFGDVYRKDVSEGAWKLLKTKVSKRISKYVVSLASFNGSRRFFSCTGVFIDWDGEGEYNNVSIILTSASLVRNFDRLESESNIVDSLKIEVRPSKGPVVEGTLMHYNLHYNVALVSVKRKNAASLAIYKHKLVKQSSEVVAIGRCFKSGDLMASRGELVSWSGRFSCKSLLYSTCKTTKIGIGGPLLDLAGNFIGMNFYDPKLGTPAVSRGDIVNLLKCLNKKGTSACMEEGDGLNWWPVPHPYWRDEEEPEKSCLSECERRILKSQRYVYTNGRLLFLM